MSDYVPTLEEVRTDYIMAYAERDSSQALAAIAFDRWIVEHDAQVVNRVADHLEALAATAKSNAEYCRHSTSEHDREQASTVQASADAYTSAAASVRELGRA